jgi:hypothetical protein
MKEDSEENMPATYDGKGIRGWGWALFGVTTAIAAKYVMGNGGGLLGNGMPPPGDPPWARDMNYERELTKANAEIGQLKAEKYADAVTLAAERRLADKIEKIETAMQAGFRAQGEYNVANTAAVASTNAQVAQLMRLTGLVINAPTMLASEAGASAFKAASPVAAAA